MTAQQHRSDTRILGLRTLEQDHHALAAHLRSGMSVLDVGCGTGAITTGIAKAVEPGGDVVGIDRDEVLLAVARANYAGQSNLRFLTADISSYVSDRQFDVVNAARTLQWISAPDLALGNMRQACIPCGTVIVLDYDHELNHWKPEPPPAFLCFYNAFLVWRRAHSWRNRMASTLPQMFTDAGFQNISIEDQDEVTTRGEPDFAVRSRLWLQVIENVADQLVNGNFCTSEDLYAARGAYSEWIETKLQAQTLVMKAVTGQTPRSEI